MDLKIKFEPYPNENYNKFLESNAYKNENFDQDIIILNEDDLIQTTLNLFHAPNNNVNIQNNLPFDTASQGQNSLLIDLTQDFDLDEIFLLDAGGNANNNNVCFNKNESEFESKLFVKNELDLKCFNFGNSDSTEEILIEDDAEEEEISCENTSIMNQNLQIIMDKNDKNLNQLKCENCGKIFRKKFNLERHMFMHQSKEENPSKLGRFKLNKCSKCDREIVDKSNFLKHLKLCNVNIEQYKNFIVRNSNVEIVSNKKSKDSKTQNTCKLCSKVFNKKFNYQRHLKTHETPNFECDKCSRKFNEEKNLIDHKQKWHQAHLVCEICNSKLIFTEKLDYFKHMNSIHGVKLRFQCKICMKNFNFLSQFLQHKHSKIQYEKRELDKNYEGLVKCKLCSKNFYKQFNLNRHMNTVHRFKSE
jgi:uncharacterized C2H2 Zn-finger protein